MPVISQFYGIIIQMFFREEKQHYIPHIHVIYNEFNAVYDLTANKLEGELPIRQAKLVEAWILLHTEELKSLWSLMKNGDEYFKIEPLR